MEIYLIRSYRPLYYQGRGPNLKTVCKKLSHGAKTQVFRVTGSINTYAVYLPLPDLLLYSNSDGLKRLDFETNPLSYSPSNLDPRVIGEIGSPIRVFSYDKDILCMFDNSRGFVAYSISKRKLVFACKNCSAKRNFANMGDAREGALEWSPDKKKLYFINGERHLCEIDFVLNTGEDINTATFHMVLNDTVEDFAFVKERIVMVTTEGSAKYLHSTADWKKLGLMENETITQLKHYKGIYVLASYVNGSIVETRLHLFDVRKLKIKKSIWGDSTIEAFKLTKHKMDGSGNHFRDVQFLPSTKGPFKKSSSPCHLIIGMYREIYARVYVVSERDIMNTGITFDIGKSHGYCFSLVLLPKENSFLAYTGGGPIIKCTINFK